MNKFSLVYFPVTVIQSSMVTEYLRTSYSFVSADRKLGYPPVTSADIDDFVSRLGKKDFPEKFKKRYSKDFSKLSASKFWSLFAEYFKDKCGDYKYTEGLTGHNVDTYKAVKDTFGTSADFQSTDRKYSRSVKYYIVDLDSNSIYDRTSKIVQNVDELAVAEGNIITTGVVIEDWVKFLDFVDVQFWKGATSRLYLKPLIFFDQNTFPLRSPITELYLRLAYEQFAPGAVHDTVVQLSGNTDVSFYLARCLEEYGYQCVDRSGATVDITAVYSDIMSESTTIDVRPGEFPGKTLASGKMPSQVFKGVKAVFVCGAVLALIYALLFTKTSAAFFDALYDILPNSIRTFLNPLMNLNIHRWRETEVHVAGGGFVEAKTLFGDSPTHLLFSDVGYVDPKNFSLSDKNGLVFVRGRGKIKYYVVDCRIQESILVFRCRRLDGVTVEVSYKPKVLNG